jgi:hypothetical protein
MPGAGARYGCAYTISGRSIPEGVSLDARGSRKNIWIDRFRAPYWYPTAQDDLPASRCASFHVYAGCCHRLRNAPTPCVQGTVSQPTTFFLVSIPASVPNASIKLSMAVNSSCQRMPTPSSSAIASKRDVSMRLWKSATGSEAHRQSPTRLPRRRVPRLVPEKS